jgi:hypothetical protein
MKHTAYILGAGFSHYAGLPLQAEFTKELLAARNFGPGPSRAMVKYLDKFVQRVFDHAKNADAESWPELEDIFTCIDLAANTGHHLGHVYPAAELRTVRRVLIARIMRMLHQRYSSAKHKKTRDFAKLRHFLKSVDLNDSYFVSLNWDVSLEAVLQECWKDSSISYGHGIYRASFPDASDVIEIIKESGGFRVEVTKMHGSVNWLYCDCCRRAYWFPASDVPRIADQILTEKEWSHIRPSGTSMPRRHCIRCPDVELGTRIATFSYRKALEFPMFQRSWLRAEESLRRSSRWVFIGYSLPGADYEFKQLLKRVEVSKQRRPSILAVTGGTKEMATKARLNYEKFFGQGIREGETFFADGLTREVVSRIA